LNYYPLHIGDYLRDTSHLSMLEDGAYRRMLDLYYASERPLPLNLDGLYRLLRAKSKAERDAVDTVLAEFFRRQDGGWHNARADEEIARAREKSGKAKVSADKRWKSERTANASPGAMPTHSEGNAPNSQEPVAKAKSQKPRAKAADSPLRSESSTENGVADAQNRAPDTAQAWAAYREAYEQRYHVGPTPNAEDNAHMLAFVKKVPAQEAPEIAAFYVRHNKGWYVGKSHAVKWLREDAVGLRTQWLNGRKVTDTGARQADRTETRGSLALELLAENRKTA
jgi:uncharacterized protein YdaU (DUF1376 family)